MLYVCCRKLSHKNKTLTEPRVSHIISYILCTPMTKLMSTIICFDNITFFNMWNTLHLHCFYLLALSVCSLPLPADGDDEVK